MTQHAGPISPCSRRRRDYPRLSGHPQGRGPWPGVVVIQEWWGLNDNIRDIADRLAAAGLSPFAPDLYYGETAVEPDDARKLAMALSGPRAGRHSGRGRLTGRPSTAVPPS